MVNDSEKQGDRSIAGMKGLESAIANGETDRVKQYLATEMLGELQKSYLIDIAKTSNNPEIAKLIDETPTRP